MRLRFSHPASSSTDLFLPSKPQSVSVEMVELREEANADDGNAHSSGEATSRKAAPSRTSTETADQMPQQITVRAEEPFADSKNQVPSRKGYQAISADASDDIKSGPASAVGLSEEETWLLQRLLAKHKSAASKEHQEQQSLALNSNSDGNSLTRDAAPAPPGAGAEVDFSFLKEDNTDDV